MLFKSNVEKGGDNLRLNKNELSMIIYCPARCCSRAV